MFDSPTIHLNELDISSKDGLNNYLTFIYKQPMLTPEEEIDLVMRLKLKNDLAAAEKLVLSHLKLVASI